MINILADQYLYNIQSYLPGNIKLELFDPAHGLPQSLQQAHGLLVRTVIPINKQTLPTIPDRLSFVGTGSSGTDHVDISYLEQHNITFASAGGCNARSVAEYVATALLLWSEERQMNLRELSCGIVGAGHVGRQVISLLNKLGLTTVAYDPPREHRDPEFKSASMREVLSCDILSFHTPLTSTGSYPTRHWLDAQKLANNEYELLVNTSRGGVVDEKAAQQALKMGSIGDIIIDVWEDEPQFHLNTFRSAFLKTPHIAGYSVQAKQRASKFVADALIKHFNLSKPEVTVFQKAKDCSRDINEISTLSDLLITLHPIKQYEQKLEEIVRQHPKKRGVHFNRLRAEFPLRMEFSHIKLPESYFTQFPLLAELGFTLSDAK